MSAKELEISTMGTPNTAMPPGQDPTSPGRSFLLKLLGGETGGSIMMFEETVPTGTETTFHLHHDSDEVAYVLSGEITFLVGDDVTVGRPGTCAFMPRGVPHAWKSTGAETGRVPAEHLGRVVFTIETDADQSNPLAKLWIFTHGIVHPFQHVGCERTAIGVATGRVDEAQQHDLVAE